MRKNLLKTILILLILCLYAIVVLKNNKVTAKASPLTLEVPRDFGSIQDAINNANSGDVIYVRSGIYYENVVINKSVTLVGEDREKTIIDGRRRECVISIQSPNVNISGFTIQNGSLLYCGIYIGRLAANVTISNNNVRNNYIGIQIEFSSLNRICENIISANDIGILLYYSSGSIICRNVIENNFNGIYIYNSFSNEVYENILSNNKEFGVYISWNSNNNIFYHNNFNNIYQVYAEKTTNTWCINGEGNYWSDYNGKDLNKDGIGDFYYNITKGNIDYYPLMGVYKTFVASFKGNFYRVAIISNSTVLDFTFKKVAETKARIILFNTDSDVSACFSRIVIPKALMKSVHAVLVNEEEVNATLLDAGNVENIYLYVEHPGNCTIKIVYSELLDWYYQLLSNYSELLDKYRSLNESNSVLLDQYYQLLSNYSKLVDAYQNLSESCSMLLDLNVRLLELNASVIVLIEKLNMLNATLANLLKDYGELQEELDYVNSSYQNQTQNFRGLSYIFAAATAIFILITIYFSKKAHEKVAKSKVIYQSV